MLYVDPSDDPCCDPKRSSYVTVKTAGISLCYDTFGSKENECILLIMGLSAQMLGWTEEFCKKLSDEGFYVVRFDNRDCGYSDKFDHLGYPFIPKHALKKIMGFEVHSPYYTLEDMSVDAIELLDELGIEKAHFFGCSMGGMICQLTAINHPLRMLSQTLIMTTTGNDNLPGPDLKTKLIFLKTRPSEPDALPNYINGILKQITTPELYDENENRPYIERVVKRTSYHDGGRQFMAVMAAPDRTEALKNITVKTLVIHGKKDPLIPPAHADALHKAIPESELLIFDDMGHRICRKDIDPVINKFVEFVREKT